MKNSSFRKLMKKVAAVAITAALLLAAAGCSLLGDAAASGSQASSAEAASSAANTAGTSAAAESAGGAGQEAAAAEPAATAEQGATAEEQEQSKAIKVALYFSTEDNSALKAEEREIQVTGGAILKACVLALLEGPRTEGLRSNFPEGTSLRSINLKNRVCIVDFSKEFATANGIAEAAERFSVANTLTSIQGVDKVRFMVDGKDYIGPSGMPIGEMGPVLLDANGVPAATEIKTLTLYFGNSNADKVIPEKRKVEVVKGSLLERAIILELAKGPKTEGLHPSIPKGTKLLSVKTENGLCTLDLSHEFVDNSPGGTAGEAITITSVVNSLTELDNVKKVQFLIDGEKRKVYTHAVFDKPFTRNESFIGKP